MAKPRSRTTCSGWAARAASSTCSVTLSSPSGPTVSSVSPWTTTQDGEITRLIRTRYRGASVNVSPVDQSPPTWPMVAPPSGSASTSR
ncbi:MAG: hypothetical protein DYH06_06170 [Acidobacteria bacterium ACB2]|nr:hypothetical protein [Acidobacteria bacterium ACB2]